MNSCLDNCVLDTPLHSLGKEIRPQEEGGNKPERWPPGSQRWGWSWEAPPRPARRRLLHGAVWEAALDGCPEEGRAWRPPQSRHPARMSVTAFPFLARSLLLLKAIRK